MKRIALLILVVCAATPTWSQSPQPATGEVTRINSRAKEIVIRHDPIPHLAMGAMTMGFPVKDPAMLDAVKPGDKVRFVAEKVGDEAVITRIEVAK